MDKSTGPAIHQTGAVMKLLVHSVCAAVNGRGSLQLCSYASALGVIRSLTVRPDPRPSR